MAPAPAESYANQPYGGAATAAPPSASRGAPSAPARSAPRAPGRPADEGRSALVDAGAREADGQEQPTAEQPQRARMVHYNGYAKLRVTSAKQTLADAVKLGEGAGAYVEALSDTTVTLRVPVAKFRELYAALLKLGDVIDRSMTAQDVTDAFTAADLRLRTLKASRDRLIELLARARNENEKLQILAEIRRLTEEVDQLEMQLKTLASLASFSRLTIEAVPRQAHEDQRAEELAAFRWIRELSPFKRDVALQGKFFELRAPDGMVVLDNKGHFVAESADGAVIWASSRDNDPAGTSDFWLAALRERLAREYKTAETQTIGEFKVLRLVDQGDVAYRYLIGVRARGDRLDVVEVYFPSAEQEKRYGEAIKAAVERGES